MIRFMKFGAQSSLSLSSVSVDLAVFIHLVKLVQFCTAGSVASVGIASSVGSSVSVDSAVFIQLVQLVCLVQLVHPV